eukprot:g7047.t1
MARQGKGVTGLKFAGLLSTWYLVTLLSNMNGKSFVKRTLDALAPTTVSLACASAVFGARLLFLRSEDGSSVTPIRELSTHSSELHKWAAVVGFIQFLATAMTYASFALSSVSWTYCFRTLEPLISATVQYFAFHKKLSIKEITSLTVLAAGIVITVNAGSSAQTYSPWIGGLALTATAIYSTRSVCGSHVMQSYGISGRELFLLASVYGLVISIFIQTALFALHWDKDQTWTWTLVRQLVLSGVFHCIYNLMSFQILQLLQPIAHGVCNTMKRVFMVLVSAALTGQWLNYPQVFGILIANASAAMYSIEAKRKKLQEVVLASSMTECSQESTGKERMLGRLIIWNCLVLTFGLMYLTIALLALFSWRLSMEQKETKQDWDPLQFFNSMIHGYSVSSSELNQTLSTART